MQITLTNDHIDRLQKEGVNTLNQLKIVMLADKETTPSVAELAETLGVTGPSVHQAVARMEELNLVRKVKYKGDHQPERGRTAHGFVRTPRIERFIQKIST